MNCPFCQHSESLVIDTRPSTYNHIPGIRRRRTCLQCKKRFSSFEMTIHDLEAVEPATLDGILEQIVKIFKEAPTTNYKTPPNPIVTPKIQNNRVNGKTPVTPSKALTSKDIKEAMQRARRQYIEELDDLDASEFDDEDFD